MTLVSQVRFLRNSDDRDMLMSEGSREWIHGSQFDYWNDMVLAGELDGIVYAVDNIEQEVFTKIDFGKLDMEAGGPFPIGDE